MARNLLKELGAVPPTGAEQPSLESLLGPPTPAKGAGLLETIGDVLGRPYAAVGEGFGALRSGKEGVGGAMWRGFWEGEQLYKDLAEQLVPDDPDDSPDEKVAKKIGRFAISVAGDPLMYVPATWVTKPAKFLSWPVRKSAQVLRKIPTPQILSRMALPMTHVFKKFGGRAGAVTSRKLKAAYEAHKLGTGRMEQTFMEKVYELGLAPGRFKDEALPFRKAAMDLLRGLPADTPFHTDSRTQQLFQFVRGHLDGYAGRVEGYRDPRGKQFKIIEPMLLEAQERVIKKARKLKVMGNKWSAWRDEVWEAFEKGSPLPDWVPSKNMQPAVAVRKARALYNTIEKEMGLINYRPRVIDEKTVNVFKKGFHQLAWRRRENYAPFMLNEQFAEQLFKGRKGYHKAVRQFAKKLGVSNEKALQILKNMALPRRAGNIEYARHLPFDEAIFETDPLVWFPKYVNQVEERIAYADQFGLNGEILHELVGNMKRKSKIDKKWVDDAQQIILGKHQSERSITDVARKIMGAQVLTKMGFLSSLSNLSQNTNTIIREGGTNFLKGVVRAMTSNQARRQGYIAYQKGIQDELIKLAGGHSRWAHKYLDLTLFNPIERLNRILAANAGIARAEQLAKRALRPGGSGKLTTDLARRGVTERELLDFAQNGRFADETLEKIGFLASDATQHATHWKDLPIGWQDPFMRIMTQYKNFIYQQTRYIGREILKPAKEYFETRGHQGSIAPLARAVVAFGIAAETTGFLRDQAKMGTAKLANLFGEWVGAGDIMDYEPREREDRWFVQLLQDALHVGALGIAGDLVERATYRDLNSWILGPTFGDLTGFIEEASATVNRITKEQDQPYEAWIQNIARRVPFATGVAPRKSTKPIAEKTVEAGRDLLKELGYGR